MPHYYKLEKLTGAENYATWEVGVRSEMIQGEIFKIIKSSYVVPIDPSIGTVLASSTAAVSTAPASGESSSKAPVAAASEDAAKKVAAVAALAAYEKFLDLNELALSAIHLSISKLVYAQIQTITDAREAWKKLKEMYGENTEAMFEKALRKLSSMQQEDYKDLPAYLSDFKNCTAKLAEMGSEVPHRQQVVYYKIGLSRYLQEQMFTISQHDIRNKKEISLDFITTELENRVISDRPKRSDDTIARRSQNDYRQSKDSKADSGPKGTPQKTAKTHDLNDHKHEDEPCKWGKECYIKYPETRPKRTKSRPNKKID